MKKQTQPEPNYASTLPGIFVALDQLKRMASLTDKDNIIDGKHYQNYLPELIKLYLKAYKKENLMWWNNSWQWLTMQIEIPP